ncbi:MAG: hypothetical protein GKR94_18760 [Gammaproteobacteria bacterium]|nr:hypothetical protein [Gammaproteobacteria bacterium]
MSQFTDKQAHARPLSEALLRRFVDLYCELCRVNRRIGIWDMRRHAACKAPVEAIDTHYLVKTERLGRQNVERRAAVKTQIDQVFAELVRLNAKQSCPSS